MKHVISDAPFGPAIGVLRLWARRQLWDRLPNAETAPLAERKLRGNDARPERGDDEARHNDPDAVGDDEQEKLGGGGVAQPEVGATAQFGEAVEIEDGLPGGDHRHGQGQRHGVAALLVVLQPSQATIHVWRLLTPGEATRQVWWPLATPSYTATPSEATIQVWRPLATPSEATIQVWQPLATPSEATIQVWRPLATPSEATRQVWRPLATPQ